MGEVCLNANSDNNQSLIFRTLDSIHDVPTLPAIALRAVEISNDDDSSAKELAEFIGQDQALTTTLLSITNSAAFGLPGKVATVDRAVVIMGFSKVRALVLASATANFFSGESDCLDRASLWRHSIGTATAARLLAKGEAGINPEAAYIAGLLHEVGVVILDRYFHDALKAAVSEAHSRRSTIDAALRNILGIDQFKVGGYLAQRWHLPTGLATSIGMHNSPPIADGNAQVIAIVHVASMIADACKMNYEPFSAHKPISANAIQLLSITPIKVQSTADELRKHRTGIEEFAKLCTQ